MIFQLKGEAYFRQAGKGRAAFGLRPSGADPVARRRHRRDEDNIRLMRHNSRIVFLDRDLERLAKADPSRPLSASAQAVQKMYEKSACRSTANTAIASSQQRRAQKETVRRIEEKIHETVCH